MIQKIVIAALVLGWFATAQASASSHFHTYVSVSIDDKVAFRPVIASASGVTASFTVPGGPYAELTSRVLDAASFEVQENLYVAEGGLLIGSSTFRVRESRYSAVIEYPAEAAPQIRLQLRGQRLELPAAVGEG